jgi:hypothetical protein
MAKKDNDDVDEAPKIYGGMTVWVFMGDRGTNPMGIWTTLDAAHKYVHDEQLTGQLTAVELNQPVYEWAKKTGRFKPKLDQQRSIKFRQTFSNQFQEHYTFKEGHCQALGTPRNFEDQAD